MSKLKKIIISMVVLALLMTQMVFAAPGTTRPYPKNITNPCYNCGYQMNYTALTTPSERYYYCDTHTVCVVTELGVTYVPTGNCPNCNRSNGITTRVYTYHDTYTP